MRFLFSLFLLLSLGAGAASAQTVVKVAEHAWTGLTAEERAVIQKTYVVQITGSDSFGTIIDNPGMNESRPGTTGGAQLGAAFADAAYIDRAFKPGGNYSAKENLGYALLGAVIGSALDQPATVQYRFRYAVRLGSGEIRYYDEVRGDAFRQPAGICVMVPALSMADQSLCQQDVAALRGKYLGVATAAPPAATFPPPAAAPQPAAEPATSGDELIQCRLGTVPAVRTTAEKCTLIGGTRVR